MAQSDGQTNNHNTGENVIPPSRWGLDIEVDEKLVRQNLLEIQNKIAHCKPRIIGVTKYYGLSAMISGYKAGLRDFGESRAIDAIKKIENLPAEIRENSKFHFIGHLQTNKVDKVVKHFDFIQSVDSLHLAAAISDSAVKQNKSINLLLQLNNACEEQKFGYSKETMISELPEILKLRNINIKGLMNMAPLGASEEVLKTLFSDVRSFRDKLEKMFGIKLPELSMGMSDDYEIAVNEGATMIRVGRKLFT